MTDAVRLALIATVGTWLMTALGAAAVVFFRSPNQKVLDFMLGFSAGVMIAASFWSLLLPAIERAETTLSIPPWLVAAAGFLCGALFIWISDNIVTYVRNRLYSPRDRANSGLNGIIMLALSITLHNIPEGLVVGVAFGALHNGRLTAETVTGAATIALGIGLQNIPEGAAVSIPLRREGFSRRKSFLLGQASGLVEPAAGVIGALLVINIEPVLPFALAFAAGAMILVAVHELIPECQKNQRQQPYFATMGILLGFAVMMSLDVMLG
ncbi:MAG: ZIP family metal transporter [Oscillospiraceae bacterium]|jgi:ZIP family zinc transporter|nr:ZIP family metal transporter [Oscillospiraceae bacterium]